jgi:sulfopyruvate decarboxylase TPP-binding subunit
VEAMMLDGHAVAVALAESGATHIVWIPDSIIGTWQSALLAEKRLQLIRVCREGEAIGVAAGLLLGGARPVVMMQCTGLFEAGDALRNVVHDLRLPLFLLVGIRGYRASQQGATGDTCPVFAEPILRAWQIPCTWLDGKSSVDALSKSFRQSAEGNQAGAALVPE